MKLNVFRGLILLAMFAAAPVVAQPPEGPPPGRGPRDGERPPRRDDDFRPPVPPLVAALDTDRDGEISAEEIANAATTLKTLDRNGDGKLTPEEIRPMPPRDGFGPPEGRGPDGRRPDGPRPEGDRPRPDGERPNPRGGDAEAFLERFMSQDKNGDGKVSKDELPEERLRMLEFADRDGDDAVSRDEARQMIERFRQRGPAEGARGERPRGEGNRGDRPRGERPPRDSE